MSAVLFDIGSTLVQGPAVSPAKMISRLLGMPDSQKGEVADVIMCSVFETPENMSRCLRERFPLENFPQSRIEAVWRDQETAPVEICGATGVVRRIKELGARIGLVSDIWEPYYRGFLSACPELAGMVDYEGLSFREGVRKPSTALLEKAVETLGVKPWETWMVGDTYLNDLAPAMKMGLRTVWVLNRPDKEFGSMEGVLKGRLPRPDIIVDSVADLAGLDFCCASR
ncbi:MAG: HAD family hydrolase [Bacillota bacterium]